MKNHIKKSNNAVEVVAGKDSRHSLWSLCKDMRLIKSITILSSIVVLLNCGPMLIIPDPRMDSNPYVFESTAEEELIELAGDVKPKGLTLFNMYKEITSETLIDGSKFKCNGLDTLTVETDMKLYFEKYNYFTGVKKSSDDCGVVTKLDIVGRYNHEYIYIYMPSDRKKSIYKYKIEQEGTRLRSIEKIYLINNIKVYRTLKQHNQVSGNSKFSTTHYYFINKVNP